MEEAFDNWKRAKKLSKEMKLYQFYSGVKIMTCVLLDLVSCHMREGKVIGSYQHRLTK